MTPHVTLWKPRGVKPSDVCCHRPVNPKENGAKGEDPGTKESKRFVAPDNPPQDEDGSERGLPQPGDVLRSPLL
jgi:hypothetical protein